MGELWRARDTRLSREVAIELSQAEFTDRFQREANTVASPKRPNICSLFDLGPYDLVIERIDSPTLADHIKEGPREGTHEHENDQESFLCRACSVRHSSIWWHWQAG